MANNLDLDELQLEVTNEGIELISPKNDATVVFRQSNDTIWHVYATPLSKDMSFEAKAERIGYIDSEILEYSAD